MSNNFERGLWWAKKISKQSTHKRYKLGCALYRKNRLVSLASNINKTHPFIFRNSRGITLHAEINALLKRTGDPDYAYIYREDASGEPAMARPCKMCYAALLEVGIKRIIYTTGGGYIVENI